jgi:hypothetical protein
MPGEAIADQIGRAAATGTCRLELLHIPKFNPELLSWTPEEDKLLGANIAKAIAQNCVGRQAE